MTQEMLSYSRTAEWLRCRYRWELHYERKVSPRVDERAPALGSAVHVGIAAALKAHARGESALDQQIALTMAIGSHIASYLDSHTLFDEEIETTREIGSTATNIGLRAVEWLKLEDWETLCYQGEPLIDRQIVVPLKGWGGFQAYYDWVAFHRPTGLTWLIDHKVRKQFLPMEAEEVSLQMAVYQKTLQLLGIERVAGSRTFQIRSALPQQPSLNKNGTMSRVQITSDWPTYRQALLDNGLNPEDYIEMADKLTTPFFGWTEAYRSPKEINAIWNNTVVPASREMLYKRRYFPRNMAFLNCQGCWAKRICLEEARGSDIGWIIESEFSRGTESPSEEGIAAAEMP